MDKLVFWLCTAAIIGVTSANFKSGKAKTLPLNDGNEIPVLGLGTSVDGEQNKAQAAVEVAISAGYRHIDTASLYSTEKQIGLAIKAKIGDGTIKREDVFITTKLWNDKHRQEQVVPALRESLKNLGMDYVDLYLIHTPESEDEHGNAININLLDTWKGMEEAKRLGLTTSIGVSNFNETQIQKLLDSSTVKPAVNQIEVHPNLTQKKLVSYCQERGVQVVAHTPLGAIPSSKDLDGKQPPPKLDDPVLTAIGHKYNKSTVQVVLRYLIDRDVIPIPKSLTPSRIRQNIDVFDFKLTPEEVAEVDKFNLDYSLYDSQIRATVSNH